MFFLLPRRIFFAYFSLLFPYLSLQFLFNLVANPTSSWLNLITISFFCSVFSTVPLYYIQFFIIIKCVSTHMSQILISYIMNTNLPVSVCVIRRQQILTHILLIFCSKFAYSAMQEGMEEKTCKLAAIVCNCNTFDEDPKVEISNKTTEC